MTTSLTAAQRAAENAKDNWNLGVLLYKDPAATGYNPKTDLAAASLAAMNSGSGISSVEFNGTGYTRKALTFVAGGSGVVTDAAAILAKLIADADSYVSLSASADMFGGEPVKVGGYIIYGEDSAADANRWVVSVIELQTPRQPDGGSFDIVWPDTGVLIVR